MPINVPKTKIQDLDGLCIGDYPERRETARNAFEDMQLPSPSASISGNDEPPSDIFQD